MPLSELVSVAAPTGRRVAVVTGGGRGLGAAIARALASAGVSVIVASRSADDVARIATELRAAGATAMSETCDVSDPDAVRRLARASEALGPVDILVNNAGVASAAPLPRTSLEEWNRLLAVNATGPFLCMQAFLPAMIQRGWGRVVNIASTAALTADRYIAAYAASKHALLGLTRAAAAESASRGVTVNAVCPGFLSTDMTEASLGRIVEATGRSREDALKTLSDRNPQRRLIEPGEVAAAVLYLCSDAARGINGEALVIDGGELRR